MKGDSAFGSGALDWRTVHPAADRRIYQAAGYGRPSRPGVRPAVVVIDTTYQFVGRPLPILDSMAYYPSSCGIAAWNSLAGAEVVLDAARRHAVPVFYTVGGAAAEIDRLQQRQHKHPGATEQPPDAGEIVEIVAPAVGDIVLPKTKPSAFAGTPLLSLLVYARVDSVILTGGTTSGCVRATATDAFSLGLSVIVVEDATFDRSQLSQAVSLFDLDQKYADVRSSVDVAAELALMKNGGADVVT
jgi:maleamate amidohydrolase